MPQPSAHFRTLSLIVVCFVASLGAQSQTSPKSAIAVPAMVRFSGTVNGAPGRLVGLTFALYRDQTGGAPLWLETQSVVVDASGHYTVQLGATLPNGVPQEFFVSGEARWLGVQREGQSEQPRVLLLSVPYALKAADAETLGGLPASAFALVGAPTARAATNSVAAVDPGSAPPTNGAVTGVGVVSSIPLWDSTSDIVSSAISQTGTGAAAKVGINNAAPSVTLDVKGASTIRGALTMPTIGIATATAGKNSQPLNLSGSAFNSGTGTAANQTFRLQTEPAGNNTASASGKLSLLYYAGANSAAETGLSIASNGQITFAAGQTFPGGGGGGITGVTAGTALTGGGSSGNVTLNVDTTKIPQLAAANIFTNNQAITGNLSASGTVTSSTVNASSGFNLQGAAFAYGSSATNLFVGFGTGNTSATGTLNTGLGGVVMPALTSGIGNVALGWNVLSANTSGSGNTGTGRFSLESNTTGTSNTANGVGALMNTTIGGENTAVGIFALANNTTGNDNTALGVFAGPYNGASNLSNTTAVGAHAVVGANNSLVLGSIAGLNGATADTFVGIGTATPTAKLDVRGTANFTGLITFAAGQTFPGAGTITGVTAGTGLTGGGTSGNVPLSLDTSKVPQLSTANTFTGNQTVNANLTATGVVSAASYQIGSHSFASGNSTTNNVYLGFAGNQTTTGYGNTGTGGQALYANAAGINNTATGQGALPDNTSGTDNVATGVVALEYNTQGNYNTANGVEALALNTTGSYNTAVGYLAGPDSNHPNLTNATAIGANAVVSESNALVLGAGVNVGIGTATPAYPLQVIGVMRSETGLSLGGNATVAIDAPGVAGGHLAVLANGNVGVNNPNPQTNLDVVGNVSASGALIGGVLSVGGSGVINGGLTTSAGITTGAGVNVGAGLKVTGNTTVGGGLQIQNDPPMHSAPRMYLTGYMPGPAAGFQGYQPIFTVLTKDILITRMTLQANTDPYCSSNPLTFSIANTATNFVIYSLTIPVAQYQLDSGPLSIPISSGTNLGVGFVSPQCNVVGMAPADIAISVEYVMQ